jgi:predicted nucleotidyltransferase
MAILESLFSSRVRTKILVAFFTSPGENFYALGLAKRLGEHYNAVWKELVHLEKAGLLSSHAWGNAKVYQLNPACLIISELRAMVLKTEGVGEVIRSRLAGKDEIKAVFIYGSYAGGEADRLSDLDLMVIGDVELSEFAPLIAELEKELNRPINYVCFSEEEWKLKVENKDTFVLNVKQSPKIMLVGSQDAL